MESETYRILPYAEIITGLKESPAKYFFSNGIIKTQGCLEFFSRVKRVNLVAKSMLLALFDFVLEGTKPLQMELFESTNDHAEEARKRWKFKIENDPLVNKYLTAKQIKVLDDSDKLFRYEACKNAMLKLRECGLIAIRKYTSKDSKRYYQISLTKLGEEIFYYHTLGYIF